MRTLTTLTLGLALTLAAPAWAGEPAAAPSEATAAPTFATADADHDGRLSREEAAAVPGLAQLFGQIDRDHDGRLTREEIAAAADPGE